MVVEENAAREGFSFDGNTGEYFRIWIVNISLTIMTLGLYSPWAKVRRLKYLYRSSHLAGGSFDYHASPIAILKGRLIGVGLMGIYFAAGAVRPGLESILFSVLIIFIPWLIVRSRMFHLRNTSFQNIRFSFGNVVGEAYRVMILGWLFVVLSLGMAYPSYKFRRARLIVANSRFGNLSFQLRQVIDAFYARHLVASIAYLLGTIVLAGFMDIQALQDMAAAAENSESAGMDAASAARSLLFLLGFFLLSFLVISALRESLKKLILNNTRVGSHALVCHWSIARILFVLLTNLLAIALSFGLLIPWATIRLRRYRLDNLSVDLHGKLEDIVAVQAGGVSALGEEVGEVFDIDLGL